LANPLPDWIAALASAAPTPGGGGASALAGAVAAALAEMVGQFTLGRAKYRDVEPSVRALLDRLADQRAQLLRLVEADTEAYGAVSAAYALPKATEDDRGARADAIQRALLQALEPPRGTAVVALDVLHAANELAAIGNSSVASDAGCAAILAEAAVRCAGLNVVANAVLLRDAELSASVRRDQEQREHEAARDAAEALARVLERMGA
jgi:formiminotetrahydrofolate cyclodeaminase